MALTILPNLHHVLRLYPGVASSRWQCYYTYLLPNCYEPEL
ncbi:hypothetical protein WKI72_04205 [Candidatus Erwinia dacicola]